MPTAAALASCCAQAFDGRGNNYNLNVESDCGWAVVEGWRKASEMLHGEAQQ